MPVECRHCRKSQRHTVKAIEPGSAICFPLRAGNFSRPTPCRSLLKRNVKTMPRPRYANRDSTRFSSLVITNPRFPRIPFAGDKLIAVSIIASKRVILAACINCIFTSFKAFLPALEVCFANIGWKRWISRVIIYTRVGERKFYMFE